MNRFAIACAAAAIFSASMSCKEAADKDAETKDAKPSTRSASTKSADAAAAPTSAASAPGKAALVDAKRIEAADSKAEAGNWLSTGRTYDEQRYSPLESVNASNVDKLGLAWSLDLDTHRGQEATPLVIDGVMYSTSAWSKVQAIDAATGKLLWAYDPKVSGEVGVNACCDVVNRGVAAWNGKLYLGTLDGRLIALDAATGKPLWEEQTTDTTKPYTITGAPRVVKGRVIIGNGGAEYGVRGYVSAYDAENGALVWRFYTVPGNPAEKFEAPILEKAAATWTGEWWKMGGGGTAWDAFAYDPKLDLLYIGVGNGSPWNQKIRSPQGGDNLFLSSILALRPDTGEYVWHYQTTPGETWDYTATQHMILADIEIAGRMRQVIMQAPKNGFFYVIDRATGELLSAEAYSTINWATKVDMATGRPVEAPGARYPAPGTPFVAIPGPLGAHNWMPMAFSPKTGLVYIPAQELGFVYGDYADFKQRPIGFNTATDNTMTSMPQDNATTKALALAGVKGYLRAWDPKTQKAVWNVEHPGAWNGGVLATAGGLVFQGNAVGLVNAYDAANGKLLWSNPAQTGVVAAPMTYAVNGEQYVAVVAGWGGAYALAAGDAANKGSIAINRSRVLAFKLGGAAKLPETPKEAATAHVAPPVFGDTTAHMRGFRLFHDYCAICHGDSVVGGGVVADLRWSAKTHNASGFKSVVLGGSLKEQGMVSFGGVMNDEDAEAIRAYITMRANQSVEQEAALKAAGATR